MTVIIGSHLAVINSQKNSLVLLISVLIVWSRHVMFISSWKVILLMFDSWYSTKQDIFEQ